MNKKYLRKIILAAAVLVLAVIYAIELAAGSRSSVKDFKIEKSFDSIVIESADNGRTELKRYGDFWKIGTEDAKTDEVNLMAQAVREIRTLSVISRSSSEDAVERYGFGPAQKITVTVADNEKECLTLEIGKDAAGGQQNYIRINGSSTIYLAAGALKNRFSKKPADLIKAPDPAPQAVPAEDSAQAGPVL